MKILHTSDWHLGRTLCGRKRHEEQQAFLTWLVTLAAERRIDAILIAGDVFDNGTPDNIAQTHYYQFLFEIAKTACRQVVVTGGNHDSPLFLEAPRALLRQLNVFVIGQACDEPADEIVVLEDQAGEPAAIVCAVPFLRDRDIRQIEAGESIEDKNWKMLSGIRRHYQAAADLAVQIRGSDSRIPIIAMGHLFTKGGKILEDDGVRDLYVGSLAHVPVDSFPEAIDYLALGHLHVPQKAGDRAYYSGSPIPMGFQEAQQAKKVMVITLADGKLDIEAVDVPSFARMETISGDLEQIVKRLDELKEADEPVLVEIRYDGGPTVSGLREKVEEMVQDTKVDVCRIRLQAAAYRMLESPDAFEDLAEMDEIEVFDRCLDRNEVPHEERAELRQAYSEIVDLIKIHSSGTDEGGQA